ncbi:MAG: YHS domain protein [Rhodobacteraceae bacterium]|nr:YHS domain protein [Paracoccaceae bacterium]
MTLKSVFLAALTALALPVAKGHAETHVYSENAGFAINGYDTVTYFTHGDPQRGNPDFAVMWKGVTWLFVSDRNRESFESNPRAYAPQFGGYCSYAVSNGYLMKSDPLSWEIVDGQLYLTFSPDIHDMWVDEHVEHIERGRGNWPAVLDE